MPLRADLIGLVDGIRRDVVDDLAGLRLHTVVTRRRVWSEGRAGLGTATDTDTVLDPVPRVREPSLRHQASEAGRYEAGDRIVDRLSATYTEADLDGGTIAEGTEFFWLVDGEAYRVVGKPEKKYLHWRVQLRRMRPR